MADEDVAYRIFWVELNVPVTPNETEEQKTTRLEAVRRAMVEQLADNMIAAGAVDININTVVNQSGGSEYKINASTVLTNPCSVTSGDNLALKRLENYGDNYPFNSAEDRVVFKEVLASMKHPPITRH